MKTYVVAFSERFNQEIDMQKRQAFSALIACKEVLLGHNYQPEQLAEVGTLEELDNLLYCHGDSIKAIEI